jgi:probable F420-dependent oxidoreductase
VVELGTIAAWTNLGLMSPAECAAAAHRVEALGYSMLWYPTGVCDDPLLRAATMLGSTTSLQVATGIACIYDYPARTTANAQRVLFDASDGRFLLGLGLSHPEGVVRAHRAAYGPPVSTMRAYLAEMDAVIAEVDATLSAVGGERASLMMAQPRVIAALGPRMLELAQQACAGAHPYLVPPDHTRQAREMLGPDTWLCVEQKVVLESDAGRARAVARRGLALYLGLENYLKSWRRMGFGDDDFADHGSDRLVDTLVAWGDEDAIRRRLDEHLAAGATQVCVQAIPVVDRPDETINWPVLGVVADLYSLRGP